MVSTVSLNGDLEFRTVELFNSELTEDHEVAEMAQQQLNKLVEKILPVLIYVDQQFGQIRGVEVTKENDFSLVLDRSGKWHRLSLAGLQEDQKDQAWRYFVFGRMMNDLNYWFAEATKKKEAHYAAVGKRRSLFNKMERGSSLSFQRPWVVSFNYWFAEATKKKEAHYAAVVAAIATAIVKCRNLFNKVRAIRGEASAIE